MIVRSFLSWYDSAPMHERVEAVQMMVQCTLAGDLGDDTLQEAESALTLVLDDPAISVRAALAWELALSDHAPRHLVLGLAHDQAEVAALVLARSPQLADADLVECARHGEALTHLAIASRMEVSASVAAALAETAGAKALIGLVENPGAEIDEQIFRTIIARHENDGALREALNQRSDLPADVRQMLIAAVSRDLLGFVKGRGWLADRRAERTVADARDAATIAIASEGDDLARFIAHLAQSGQLTPSLLIRSLLTGDTSLFGAALVCLADVAPNRVAGILRGKAGSALAATCVRAGLPRSLIPAFTAALTAISDMPRNFETDGETLQRPIISRVLAACLIEEGEELKPVLAMLRRLDAEMARAEARLAVDRMKQAAPILLDAVAAALELPGQSAQGNDGPIEHGSCVEPVLAVADVLPELVPVAIDIPTVAEVRSPTIASPDTPDLWGQRIQRVIRRQVIETAPVVAAAASTVVPAEPATLPRTTVATPSDLEKLFNEMFGDETAVMQPLKVLDGANMQGATYFSGQDHARGSSAKAA